MHSRDLLKGLIPGLVLIGCFAAMGQVEEEAAMQKQTLAESALPGFDDAVADTVTGFGHTQGAAGWQYGYLRTDAGAAGGFRPMERYEAGSWRHGNSPAPAISATTFEASPDLIPVRRWTPSTEGSVRLVGHLRKPSLETEAEFRVLVDGDEIWSRQLAREDAIRHAFDIVAFDLTKDSAVDFLVVAGPDSPRVRMTVALEIVPEPYTSRWRVDLPSGFPTITEADRQAQRQSGQRILQRIRETSEAGGGRMVIPPGDYRFNANWSRESTLKGLTNLEIVAEGVTFWFEPPHIHALLFEDCRDVTVRGLTIDFASPLWFQGRITDIDRQAKTVQAALMEGYSPRNAEGEDETEGERAFMFYDSQGGFINHRHTPGRWQLSEDGTGVVVHPERNGIPGALQVGDYLVGTIRTGAALRSVNCAGMRFEDVNIWSSPGIAVYEGGGEGGNVYLRLRATRRPHTNRLQAFGARCVSPQGDRPRPRPGPVRIRL